MSGVAVTEMKEFGITQQNADASEELMNRNCILGNLGTISMRIRLEYISSKNVPQWTHSTTVPDLT